MSGDRRVGYDENGDLIIPDDEYVRPSPRGGYALSDLACADIAVASGWIEDTPEARAAYLARKEEP